MSKVRFRTSALLAVTLIVGAGLMSGFIGWDGSTAAGQNPAADRFRPAHERPLNSLRDLSNAFVDIAEEVNPSVVTVFSERVTRVRNPFMGSPFGGLFDDFFGRPGQPRQQPEREYRQRGHGSGVIVSEDGYILTNNHVIERADTIYVRTIDRTEYAATIIGTDPKTDVAVLKIDAEGLAPARLGSSADLRVGEWVLAIGSPLTAELAQTVTQGIVSAKGRSNVGLADYEDFIQTDAAINPGNSGGPLVNLDGEVVGINTAIVSRSGGFQGIGFAVPIDMAHNIMNSLIDYGKVVRGWLGVSIQDINDAMARALGLDDTRGAIVGEVVENSPADEAGFKEGDVVVELNGEQVMNSTEFRNRIAGTPPDTRVTITVIRDGERVPLNVTLAELEGEGAAVPVQSDLEDLLGFTVGQLTSDLARQYGIDRRISSGVVVTSIDPGSSAYRAGLREGDVIRSVNRRRITTVEEFSGLLSKATEGTDLLLRIIREGNGFYIAFRL